MRNIHPFQVAAEGSQPARDWIPGVRETLESWVQAGYRSLVSTSKRFVLILSLRTGFCNRSNPVSDQKSGVANCSARQAILLFPFGIG